MILKFISELIPLIPVVGITCSLDLLPGTIPDWISGSVVRVGPGKFEFGEDQVKHWFDGHGIVHRFNLHKGNVTFESRLVSGSKVMSGSIWVT